MTVWITIIVAGAATFAMRAVFLLNAHRMTEIPTWAMRLLRQIPPAVFAAMTLPAIFQPNGTFDLAQPKAAGGVLAALVAWKTRNTMLTIVVGIGVVMAIEALT